MAKRLNQLVPDLRRALRDATIEVAHDVTLELKLRGPYWDGVFQDSWEVRKGQTSIPATRKGADPSSDEAQPKDITPPEVPSIGAMNLNGFTIGNRAEYRAIAMDLEPGRDGLRGDRPGATAEKDWYELYIQGGAMDRDIAAATDRAFGQRGF